MSVRPEIVDKILKLRALGAQQTPEGATAREIASGLMARHKITERDLQRATSIVLAPAGSPRWHCRVARTLCVFFEVPGGTVVEHDGEVASVECDASAPAEVARSELATVLLLCKTSRLHKRVDLLDGLSDGLALELGKHGRVREAVRAPPRKKGTVLPDPATAVPGRVTRVNHPVTPANPLDYELGVRMGTEAAKRLLLRRGRGTT